MKSFLGCIGDGKQWKALLLAGAEVAELTRRWILVFV